jgi:hypothetical protein
MLFSFPFEAQQLSFEKSWQGQPFLQPKIDSFAATGSGVIK